MNALENPDYTDPDDLQRAYDRSDSIADAAEAFPEVTYHTVYQRMVEYGIHTPGADNTGDSVGDETEPAVEADAGGDDSDTPDGEPPIDWDFENGWTTVYEQEDRSHDRVAEDPFCDRCGAVCDGDLCDGCVDRTEEDLVTDGGMEGVCPCCGASFDPGDYRCGGSLPGGSRCGKDLLGVPHPDRETGREVTAGR